MSTSKQDPRVQQIETLGSASANVEMYGQKLRDALAQAYWSAQNGDGQKLSRAYRDATEHANAMRKTLLSASEALDALVGEPEPDLGKFRDLVSRVEKGVREEENGTLEIPERDEHKAACQTIFHMSDYAELLSFAAHSRYTTEVEMVAAPEALDEVRFAKRLSMDLYDAYQSLDNRRWKEAATALAGAMADLSIYRRAFDPGDQHYPEITLAEHMFDEIDRIEQYVHTQRQTSEVQS